MGKLIISRNKSHKIDFLPTLLMNRHCAAETLEGDLALRNPESFEVLVIIQSTDVVKKEK